VGGVEIFLTPLVYFIRMFFNITLFYTTDILFFYLINIIINYIIKQKIHNLHDYLSLLTMACVEIDICFRLGFFVK